MQLALSIENVPSDANARLKASFEQYVLLDPRSDSGALDSDLDVDLWAEDTYLAGLVTSYLKKDRFSIDELVLAAEMQSASFTVERR